MPTLIINGAAREVTAEEAMPLLCVLRDVLGLVGTKYGCGVAACAACRFDWTHDRPIMAANAGIAAKRMEHEQGA